jgi:hypothetical protein
MIGLLLGFGLACVALLAQSHFGRNDTVVLDKVRVPPVE